MAVVTPDPTRQVQPRFKSEPAKTREWKRRTRRKLVTRSGRKDWHKVKAQVLDRDGGRCQARFSPGCTYRAEHAHHVILRSRGGTDEPWNLLGVCHRCHDLIHREPAEATRRGLMASAR